MALKKLTTPATRPLAFAVSYATFNLAGACADLLIDRMKGGRADAEVAGLVYTPLRQFVVRGWVCARARQPGADPGCALISPL